MTIEDRGNCVMIPGVTDDTSLGKYLVGHGMPTCPKELRPYLNYSAIGAAFFSDRNGEYTAEGYAVKKTELPEPLRSIKEPEPWRNENREEVIRMELEAGGQEYLLILPADNEYLDQVCSCLGIGGFADARIKDHAYGLPYLADLLPTDCISVEGANELAEAVEEMLNTDGELLRFCSVLAVEKPQDFPAAVKLAKDMDNYERVPTSEEEYGREALRRIGADDELLDTIDGYMNFSAFGDACMVEDGVAVTSFGAVRRLDEPFPSDQAQSQQMM